ncbi:MAG TPA: hypothetical protein VF681_00215 [Abditibacteriaceae bacterium]|jgi:hypothetical protein
MTDSDFRMLYFPSFEPDIKWLKSNLLLFDQITRIVPNDANHVDSAPIQELKSAMPEALGTYSPSNQDISVGHESLNQLDLAFGIIAAENQKTPDEIRIVISPSGKLGIENHVFLHDLKMSHLIRDSLVRHKLIRPELNSLIEHSVPKGYSIVDKRASGLILSCVAAKIARKHGWDTITDRRLEYALTATMASQDQHYDSDNNVETMLLSAITNFVIPKEISELKMKDYTALRAAYSDVRASFRKLAAELAHLNRLDRIEDPTTLIARIESTASDFHKEWRTYHDSRFHRKFETYMPIFLGSLVTVAAAHLDFKPLEAALLGGATSILQKVFESRLTQRVPTEAGQRFDMISGIHRQVIPRDLLDRFLN